MRNKIIKGAIAAILLLSAAVLFWYFTPPDVKITGLEAPKDLVIGQLSSMKITLQNNASEDINVTLNVKNAFVDEKGISLEGFTILASENLSMQSNITDNPRQEVLLKPGSNSIVVMLGYQVPGTQKVELEVYQQGKLADSRAIEINVPPPKIALKLWNNKGINGTDEIHTVYGDLASSGQGNAPGVVVNILVINELTNTTVSSVTRTYSLNVKQQNEPLVVWEARKSISDPVTGMQTATFTETFAPVAVIELSKGEPSDEKYILSPVVVKGKKGDRYKVVVTARWREQVVSSEIRIPP